NGGNDTSAPQTFAINVIAVNDAPSFTKGADQSVPGNGIAQTGKNWGTNISAGPAGESGATPNFFFSNNNNGLVSEQPAVSPSGTLTYTPANNATGSAMVTVALVDSGSGVAPNVNTSVQTFQITVNPLCSDPQLVTSVLDDGSAGTLRYAIANSCAGTGTITFNLPAGPRTITPGSSLTVCETLSITGPTHQARKDKGKRNKR